MEKAPVVLFAERDLAWGRWVRVHLRRRGALVYTAGTVDEAMHRAALSAPDVLVLDADLEGGEGRDLAALFRAALPSAQIIFLGSDARPRPDLLFSGPRPGAENPLLGLIVEALEGRLTEPIPEGNRHKILCVDDDPRYLKAVSRLLTRRGYSVSSFESAERALEAIPWLKPDLAVVDIMMPGMDGLQLAEQISAEIPVVFLSALDSAEAYYESHQRGGRYHLAKSEDPQRVLDVVDFLAGDLDDSERELLRSQL